MKKYIEGYKNRYIIYDDGKVWDCWKECEVYTYKGYSYMQISLTRYDNGKRTTKTHYIHRLLAEAFIPNPNGYNYINHIDENKLNNTLSNLEWCTQKYNCNYGDRNKKISDAHKKRIICTTNGKIYESVLDAALDNNIRVDEISRVLAGKHGNTKRYSAKGLQFNYLD